MNSEEKEIEAEKIWWRNHIVIATCNGQSYAIRIDGNTTAVAAAEAIRSYQIRFNAPCGRCGMEMMSEAAAIQKYRKSLLEKILGDGNG